MGGYDEEYILVRVPFHHLELILGMSDLCLQASNQYVLGYNKIILLIELRHSHVNIRD